MASSVPNSIFVATREEGIEALRALPPDTVIMGAGWHNGDAIWTTAYFDVLCQTHQAKMGIITLPGLVDVFAHHPKVRQLIVCADVFLMNALSLDAAALQRFPRAIPSVMYFPVRNDYNCARYKTYFTSRGYQIHDIRPDLHYSPTEIDDMARFMAAYAGGPKFLFEIFCYSSQSAFSIEWFNRLTNYLERIFPEAWFFVSCSPKERERLPPRPRVVALDRFTVRQSAYALNFCDGFFTVGSGVGNACSGRAIKQGVMWVENTVIPWHSTMGYDDPRRRYYVGYHWDDYLATVKSAICDHFGVNEFPPSLATCQWI
jgi:hypothetical protein